MAFLTPRLFLSRSLSLSFLEFNLWEGVLGFYWNILSAPSMLSDTGVKQICTKITMESSDVFSGMPHQSQLTLENPDEWRSPVTRFICDSLEGSMGKPSHLTEVLNHNVFSGSSWDCLVIKARRRRSNWHAAVLWPSNSALLLPHNLPSFPVDTAQVTPHASTDIIWILQRQ